MDSDSHNEKWKLHNQVSEEVDKSVTSEQSHSLPRCTKEPQMMKTDQSAVDRPKHSPFERYWHRLTCTGDPSSFIFKGDPVSSIFQADRNSLMFKGDPKSLISNGDILAGNLKGTPVTLYFKGDPTSLIFKGDHKHRSITGLTNRSTIKNTITAIRLLTYGLICSKPMFHCPEWCHFDCGGLHLCHHETTVCAAGVSASHAHLFSALCW